MRLIAAIIGFAFLWTVLCGCGPSTQDFVVHVGDSNQAPVLNITGNSLKLQVGDPNQAPVFNFYGTVNLYLNGKLMTEDPNRKDAP